MRHSFHRTVPYFFATCALALATAPSTVQASPPPQYAVLTSAVPLFTSAAVAREWGDAQAKAGRNEAAAQAYFQEAALRVKLNDPDGAEVERRRAWRLSTNIAVGMPVSITPSGDGQLAKLEPVAGCLLGCLDTPTEGRTFDGESVADSFSDRIGKPVAVAFRYIRYGQPFPFAWARQQAQKGRAIELAMEPYDIFGVNDDEYLEGFAADLKQSGAQCFLRFGGEMNGGWAPWGKDPEQYRRAFRTVHDVMAEFAPTQCAMVWAPDMAPLNNIDQYYPGDDAVDWVGLSLYLVKYYDDQKSEPGWQDSPAVFIDPFYKKYCERKPMCLVECGITREAHCEGVPDDNYAAARITDLMSAIKIRYPRLKMVCWFDRNNLNGLDVDRRLNDFSLPPGSGALAAFKASVADSYFLSTIPQPTDPLVAYETLGSTLPSGFSGQLSLSITTYCLNPTVTVSRNGQTVTADRTDDVAVPDGTGPVTITVKDDSGHVAKTMVLSAPVTNYLASR
jgi:hypothetical protein